MGKSYKYFGRVREKQSFANPLIDSGFGLGRRNKFTTRKEDRKNARRAKQQRQRFEGAADY